MKYFLTLGLGALLAGCDSGKACESGDICDSGNGGSDEVLLDYFAYDCDNGADCYWWVESTGELGAAEIEIIQTGDPTWECGPAVAGAKGDLECGVWHELHNNLSYDGVSDAAGGDVFAITLELLTEAECGTECWRDQVDNVSTLFDMTNSEIEGEVTVLATIYDSQGNYADCGIAGEYPEYYAGACANDWGPFVR